MFLRAARPPRLPPTVLASAARLSPRCARHPSTALRPHRTPDPPLHLRPWRRSVGCSVGAAGAKTEGAVTEDEDAGGGFSFDSIDALTASLHALRGDPLEADGGNIVVYRGSPTARVMVIGEAPGADEDAQGVPFVGRAGQLLDKIFAAVTIDTNRLCYVTNVVKRRPLNNRDPTAGEIAFYRRWLMEEIRLVDPAIVVLTGRHSMRTVLGKTDGITKVRGKWFDVDGRFVMPIFHPSYLLRNPQRIPGSPKALTWDDIREVKRKIDELELYESEIR